MLLPAHTMQTGKELTLTDLVEYKNLIPGKEYKLTGTLMDAETENLSMWMAKL